MIVVAGALDVFYFVSDVADAVIFSAVANSAAVVADNASDDTAAIDDEAVICPSASFRSFCGSFGLYYCCCCDFC